jgi:hypothetical protein
MKPLVYIFIVSVLSVYSCNFKKQNVSFVGKWHRFSMQNGYTEFQFDSKDVVYFNQKTGRFKFEYKIENDSFKYVNHKYAAKFRFYGDSICLNGNDGSTATLYRYNEQEAPFANIPEEKDSLLFDSYVKGFDQRTVQAYEKAGFKFSEYQKENVDTTQSFQNILNMKDQ